MFTFVLCAYFGMVFCHPRKAVPEESIAFLGGQIL